jgi:hypothetical protein
MQAKAVGHDEDYFTWFENAGTSDGVSLPGEVCFCSYRNTV